jgi:hypothetical protein
MVGGGHVLKDAQDLKALVRRETCFSFARKMPKSTGEIFGSRQGAYPFCNS